MSQPPDSSDPRSAAERALLDFIERQSRGEAISFEEYCMDHPDLAAELRRRYQSALDGMKTMIASEAGREAQPSRSASNPPSERIAKLRRRPVSDDRYQLEGEVAHGGMAAILKVWDDDLRRHLAMKVMLGPRGDPSDMTDPTWADPSPSVNEKRLARFLEEAQVTSQLDHPGIVPVHELGLDSRGRVYFTMKLVKGHDFKQILEWTKQQKEGWNETRALGILLRVCEAMAFAHSKGVIHRDLKPGNLMVGKFGEAYVMDWGLAKVIGNEDRKDLRPRSEPRRRAVSSAAIARILPIPIPIPPSSRWTAMSSARPSTCRLSRRGAKWNRWARPPMSTRSARFFII
jgi:serine/threonine protein kinase